jgi:hypothetical protein
MGDLRTELQENVDVVIWEWLMPHVRRDAVVIVNPGLDLVDVGVAIANDQVLSVQRWIGEQLLYKPSPEQVEQWQDTPDTNFIALIVQPYVLVQEKTE